ncbi:MAG: intradiol ring-cleavage dioxygenase [Hyphomicrobiales bacterium]|nr:intradiol ring-cleavage dioxygenase [Hyphomicrobiales bacterium]
MIIEDVDDVTPVVLQTMSGATSPRFKEIMEALVRHAHAFAREVNLTEAEFEIGVDFLNRIGKQTTDVHNEGILFSDSIGFSTLVCLLNNGGQGSTETAAALLGPFWRMHSPMTENGGSILRSPTDGPALFANCLIRDPSGQPIAGVEVDVWHSSPVGLYENQDDTQADMNLRGKIITEADGRISFRSVRPAGYPVPIDGPEGDMLRAQNRPHWRPAHIHFLAFREGFKTLVTQVFVDDDEHLESDVVFGVTRALVGNYVKHDGPAPAEDVDGPWYSLDYTFVMEPGVAKLPQPPIK